MRSNAHIILFLCYRYDKKRYNEKMEGIKKNIKKNMHVVKLKREVKEREDSIVFVVD